MDDKHQIHLLYSLQKFQKVKILFFCLVLAQSCEASESVNPISDGIFQAYNAAEYLRMNLVGSLLLSVAIWESNIKFFVKETTSNTSGAMLVSILPACFFRVGFQIETI